REPRAKRSTARCRIPEATRTAPAVRPEKVEACMAAVAPWLADVRGPVGQSPDRAAPERAGRSSSCSPLPASRVAVERRVTAGTRATEDMPETAVVRAPAEAYRTAAAFRRWAELPARAVP